MKILFLVILICTAQSGIQAASRNEEGGGGSSFKLLDHIDSLELPPWRIWHTVDVVNTAECCNVSE